MYTLFHSVPLRSLLVQQLPVLLISMVIAELFYKFHSFTLESIAFLATWYGLDWAVTAVRRAVRPPA